MLSHMADHEIDAVTVSISAPGAYFGDLEFTKRISRICNDRFASLSDGSKNRIASLGILPLPDAEAACREVGYIYDQLKLDGIGLMSHYNDVYIGEPDFNELYQELNHRKAFVFVHPARPMHTSAMRYSFPDGFVELVTATGRVIANLLATGVMEKYPDIKWYLPHAGGILPSIIFRLMKFEKMQKYQNNVPQGVRTYLKRIYFDIAQSAEPEILSALMKIASPDHILFGSDYPFAFNRQAVIQDTIDGVEQFDGFDAPMRQKLYRDNALEIFPRFQN